MSERQKTRGKWEKYKHRRRERENKLMKVSVDSVCIFVLCIVGNQACP